MHIICNECENHFWTGCGTRVRRWWVQRRRWLGEGGQRLQAEKQKQVRILGWCLKQEQWGWCLTETEMVVSDWNRHRRWWWWWLGNRNRWGWWWCLKNRNRWRWWWWVKKQKHMGLRMKQKQVAIGMMAQWVSISCNCWWWCWCFSPATRIISGKWRGWWIITDDDV